MVLAQAPHRPNDRRFANRAELGRAKYEVLKMIAQALTRHSLPPMDERLKSIVASHVGVLLSTGYSAGYVQRVAIAAALSWDELRGHNRLTHLVQRIRLIDTEEQRARHEQQRAREQGQLDPRVASLLPKRTGRPHPNSHPFQRSDRENSCALCDGPIGVHVRVVGIDDDGNGIVVSTGLG